MAAVNKALNPSHLVGSPLNLGKSNRRRDETGMVPVDSVGSEVGDTDGAGVDDRK